MKCLLALVGLTLALSAQTSPQVRKISGIVVDTAGRPIEGVRIDHGDNHASHVTDAAGRFEFATTARAVVVRKIGFQSRYLRTDAAQEVRVVLEPARASNSCTSDDRPKVQVTTSQDIDSVSTAYTIETKTGPASLVCGRGAMWSFGVPSDSLVWDSIEYSESMTGDRAGLVDARGKTKDGRYWRYHGTFGESCSYSKVDEATAAALDCVLERPAKR